MHSEITSDTGSTETETGRLRYCILAGTTEEPGIWRDSGTDSPPAGSAWTSEMIAFWLMVQQGGTRGFLESGLVVVSQLTRSSGGLNRAVFDGGCCTPKC